MSLLSTGSDSTMTVDSEDFVRLFMGQLNPAQAYLRGQIQIQGSQAKIHEA